MFKFDFTVVDENETDKTAWVKKTEKEDENVEMVRVQHEPAAAVEIYLSDRHVSKLSHQKVETLLCGDLAIKYVSSKDAVEKVKYADLGNLRQAVYGHTDLVTGVYEGGLKIWECSLDLVHYLHSRDLDLGGRRVLELGCGSALPAIYCYLRGATVHVQDYNTEVIDLVTIPNILQNTPLQVIATVRANCRFFAGDWQDFGRLLSTDQMREEDKYDLIVTSETIYNPDNHEKLYNLLKNTLKADGEILLAAKSFYFGIGGGTRQFEDLINEKGAMTCGICMRSEEGVPREILKIAHKV